MKRRAFLLLTLCCFVVDSWAAAQQYQFFSLLVNFFIIQWLPLSLWVKMLSGIFVLCSVPLHGDTFFIEGLFLIFLVTSIYLLRPILHESCALFIGLIGSALLLHGFLMGHGFFWTGSLLFGNLITIYILLKLTMYGRWAIA